MKKARGHKRRAIEFAASGQFTKADIDEMRIKQNGCCAFVHYCGRTLDQAGDSEHVDHKNPLSRGGSNRLRNIQLLDGECNVMKGDRTSSEFFSYVERTTSESARRWREQNLTKKAYTPLW